MLTVLSAVVSSWLDAMTRSPARNKPAWKASSFRQVCEPALVAVKPLRENCTLAKAAFGVINLWLQHT